ncbi:MAG: 4Fe-4S dicluster domain-containing protein [Actinobacteria bacterium]|nr:4Fe-4S dicluster domain-containing protein [Actinomycetota bacterium]MBU1944135.1 4Fe-4S dicluster domain-containing protein [Actinomycetota bacterium]MBU2687454.1 4Fe-4S dicluster domain-containing protein [Actinomycetota bacterium]
MGDYKFAKTKLAEVIGAMSDYQVVAPVESGEVVRFAVVDDPAKVTLEFSNTNVPPKELMFPETETLFRFRLGGTDLEPEVPDAAARRAVFGIRPCDAMAYTIVEKLYNWDFPDPYFNNRREATTLVGYACAEPCANCFCPSLGGGPGSEKGLDSIAFDLGDTMYLKTLTDKGEELVKALGGVLESAGEAEARAAAKQVEEAEGKIRRSIDTEGIAEHLPELYGHPFWEQFSDRCLSCGICTFLCPTCHCFDIQDESEGLDARRARMWDTCMFSEYSLHASGHNPRPTRKERTCNRVSHKYSFFPTNFDAIACVGCGRCINYCPVNIDLLDILEKSKQADAKEAQDA